MSNTSASRLCFFATILVGFAFLGVGILLIPALPHFQLDAVLTPDELADDAVRESTLALLEKASGNQWVLWTLGGAFQIAIGAIGLFATKRRSNTSDVLDAR